MAGEASRRRVGRPEEEPDGYAGYRARLHSAAYELQGLALSGMEIDALLEEVVERVADTLGVEFAKVLELVDEERGLLLRAGVGFEAELTGGSYYVGLYLESQAGYTLISKEPVIVEDLRERQPFTPDPLLLSRGVITSLTVKIYVGGRPYGVLGAHTTQKRRFATEEVCFLQDVANMLGDAIGRKRREEARVEESVLVKDRYASLAEFNSQLIDAPDREAMLETTASYVLFSLADWCFIDLADEEGGSFGRIRTRLVWGRGIDEDPELGELARQLGDPRNYPRPDAPHGTPKVLRTGKAELVADVNEAVRETVGRDPAHLEVLKQLGCKSYICVPVKIRERRKATIGMVSTRCERRYDEADRDFAENLANVTALAIRASIEALPRAEQTRELDQPLAGDGPEANPGGRAPGHPLGSYPPGYAAAGGTGSHGWTADLTSRETEVLRLIADGYTTGRIARALCLAENTIKSHRKSIFRKLGARREAEALRIARERGYLSS